MTRTNVLALVIGLLVTMLLQFQTARAARSELWSEVVRAKASRDSALVRELRILDSAQQTISEQDASWANYVRGLEAAYRSSLQQARRMSAQTACRTTFDARRLEGGKCLLVFQPSRGLRDSANSLQEGVPAMLQASLGGGAQ